jgi:hypothetical protein
VRVWLSLGKNPAVEANANRRLGFKAPPAGTHRIVVVIREGTLIIVYGKISNVIIEVTIFSDNPGRGVFCHP